MSRRCGLRVAGALVALALFAAFGVACGGEDQSNGVRLDPLALPAEVTGTLTITVEEGDPGSDGISAFNFGELATSEGVLLVDLDGDLARGAGLTRDQLVTGIAVTATLDAPGVASIPVVPSYRIAEIAASG